MAAHASRPCEARVVGVGDVELQTLVHSPRSDAHKAVKSVRTVSPSRKVLSTIAFCMSLGGLAIYAMSLAWLISHEHAFLCMQEELGSALAHHKDVGCNGDDLDGMIDKLVHFSCPVSSGFVDLKTTILHGKAVPRDYGDLRAIRIKQEASMYQCEELQRPGKDFMWTYQKVWSEKTINESSFQGSYAKTGNKQANNYMIDGCGSDFSGNPLMSIVSSLNSSNSLIIGVFNITQHIKRLDIGDPIPINPGTYFLPSSSRPGQQQRAYQTGDNILMTCPLETPEIGCLRVAFWKSSAGPYSVLTKLVGFDDSHGATTWRTAPWTIPANWMCTPEKRDSMIDLVMAGDHEAHEMIWRTHEQDFLEELPDRASAVISTALGVGVFLFSLMFVSSDFFSCCASVPYLRYVMRLCEDIAFGTTWLRITVLSVAAGASSVFIIIGMMALVIHRSPGLSTLLIIAALLTYFSTQVFVSTLRDGRMSKAAFD